MRHDLEGFFWQDTERISKKGVSQKEQNRPLPPLPDTGWRPPTDFPRLDAAEILAIDCETYDPNLMISGPGVRTGGHIVGLAVGTNDGGRWYFPMRHEVQSELNMDPATVMRWARDTLGNPKQPKVGANLLYDLDFLAEEGVHVAGTMLDVQVAEPLLDENARSYSLETLSQKHVGESKRDDALYAWSYAAYGGKEGRAQAANIYRCPPCLVGPYAEGDVDLPLRILEKQKILLHEQGLDELFSIESRLIPMLLAMRRRGVPIDVPAANRAYEYLSEHILGAEKALGGINVYSPEDLSRYCDKNAIEYPHTALGAPSFTAQWLERNQNPLLRSVNDIRKNYKARDTFVRNYLLNAHIKGRIHCTFNQLRSDEGGAVSGRFSSSDPNLQNIPVRDPIIGALIRSLFIAEQGETWAKLDWSQIEFRLLCHYGRGVGADEARRRYREDATTDFHKWVAEMVWPGQPEMRKPAKNVNFGLVYGMGEPHMAETLGRTLEEVRPIFERYHEQLPFVKNTYNEVSKVASSRGYITTLAGRRRRFDRWEIVRSKKGTSYGSVEEGVAAVLLDKPHLTPEAAARLLRRAFAHKSLNALLQGGAADAMKIAMVQLWESGLCAESELGAPLLTVHDELDFSVPAGKEDRLVEVRRIMETCVQLRVPLLASLETGPNWSDLKEAA